MLWPVSTLPSSVRPNTDPKWTVDILLTRGSVDGHVVCFYLLATVDPAAGDLGIEGGCLKGGSQRSRIFLAELGKPGTRDPAEHCKGPGATMTCGLKDGMGFSVAGTREMRLTAGNVIDLSVPETPSPKIPMRSLNEMQALSGVGHSSISLGLRGAHHNKHSVQPLHPCPRRLAVCAASKTVARFSGL